MKIFIKWAKSFDFNFNNFGDDLGPYIVEKLTNKQVEYMYFACSRVDATRQIVYLLVSGKLSSYYIKEYIKSLFVREYLITIGSILQYYSSRRAVVWGSGIISQSDRIKKSKFIAVRGKYTEKKVRDLGFKGELKLGDPALLLPLVYKCKNTIDKRFTLGIIPHYVHFNDFNDIQYGDDVKIINLNSKNIEDVVNDICSCKFTISSSLHGLIVSHAYGIKSLWVNLSSKPLAGDDVKFLDYFSSVGIKEYNPFRIDINNLNFDEILDHFFVAKSLCLPTIDIKYIQKDLLYCAPFKVDKKYLL